MIFCYRGTGPINEILVGTGPDERIEIAKHALPRWNLIEDVTSSVISTEKEQLRKNGLNFRTVTNDVDRYIEQIKGNYAALCSALDIR